MVQDVLDSAEKYGVDLTKTGARELIVSIEKRLAEAMTAAGWDVVDDAVVLLRRSPNARQPSR